MGNLTIADLKLMFDMTPEEQIKFLESKDIALSGDWRETAELIQKHSFAVSKAASADMLLEFKEALSDAIRNGDTVEEFRKNIRERFINAGWLSEEEKTPYRLGLIYRMNVQNAYTNARWTQMQETAADLPYLMSIGANEAKDNAITQRCKNLHRKVFRKNDVYYKINLRVPRHFGCRSREVSISETRLAELGLSVSKGEDFAQWKNAEGFIRANEMWQPDYNRYPAELRRQLQTAIEENNRG